MTHGAPDLVIDQFARSAEHSPDAPFIAGRLTNAQAWATSGAVASWLIAQGFGPEGRIITAPAGGSPERALLLLGALRAGALVVPGPAALPFGAMARCSIDAAVAERRLHIDPTTPARQHGERCERHGDLADLPQAVALPWDSA